MVTKNLMNLSLSPKGFGRYLQLSLILVKRSRTLGSLVSTITTCIELIFIGIITLVSVAFLMVLSIYRGYIVFAFSVIVYIVFAFSVIVCLFVCKLFPSKISQQLLG